MTPNDWIPVSAPCSWNDRAVNSASERFEVAGDYPPTISLTPPRIITMAAAMAPIIQRVLAASRLAISVRCRSMSARSRSAAPSISAEFVFIRSSRRSIRWAKALLSGTSLTVVQWRLVADLSMRMEVVALNGSIPATVFSRPIFERIRDMKSRMKDLFGILLYGTAPCGRG